MDRLKHAMLEYHEHSKHRVNSYAPGPGKLDWATQPDPFRVFHGAPRIGLPLAADSLTTRYNELRSGALPSARRIDLSSLAILFELSLGLSAWKSYGTQRWALRCNPSSGNLHPTEGYLLCPTLPGLSAGVYHYLSRDHSLECRAAADDERWSEAFPQSGVLVGLSSILWREAWKYGTRAWRYCQHDCGHVIAAVSYAAAALVWQTRLAEVAADDAVPNLLGLSRGEDFGKAEAEAPDALLWIGNPELRPDLERMLIALDSAQWHGRANQLSPGHAKWPDIDSIHRATHKARTREPTLPDPELHPSPAAPALDLSFARIARQRRSAVNFDGTTCIAKAALFSMLACLLPRHDTPPWNALVSPAAVHAALMVHRVGDLEPGLYMFVRTPGALPDLKRSLRPEWLWQKTGPDYLPLYLLLPYDLRATAKLICCHQDIGADSCFALGMIAGFGIALKQPWRVALVSGSCFSRPEPVSDVRRAAGCRASGPCTGGLSLSRGHGPRATERTGNPRSRRTEEGPRGRLQTLHAGGVDRYGRRVWFLSAYAKHHQIINNDKGTAHLEVGDSGWTLPIPIERTAAGWHFDTPQARAELTVRRIGRNELAAIQTVLAIGDAQRDFAKAQSETAYAQRFISHPGQRDGLYWPTADGEPDSPLGALAADMDPSAPPGYAYHGYHYRILTAQGPDAPGGAKSYISDGKMTSGFAVIAWPARYGDSGVMTFISSADGKVHQRNLGPQTASEAARITRYNPDSEWQPVPDSQLIEQRVAQFPIVLADIMARSQLDRTERLVWSQNRPLEKFRQGLEMAGHGPILIA